jgi:cardiolipin synthase
MDNSFQLLVGADAFVQAFTVSLRDCHRSLYAQFMTYEGDATGQAFSDQLAHKAVEGVDVRLMVDGYTDVVVSDAYPFLLTRLRAAREEHAQTRLLFERLSHQGVAVKRTAPPGFLGRYMLYRNHKKMVIVDERIAFVGGVNISDHNYAWHDFMVKIEGPLVRDLARDFCSTWEGDTVPFHRSNGAGDYILNQGAGRRSIFEEILKMIEQARHSLVIESPYLLGNHIETHIQRAAERGVQVTLITPSHNNKLMYRLWVRALQRRLDHPNIAIYGYQGNGGMTHAKLLIVDDEWASFGSCNMFELEGLTQKELNVFTNNTNLIAQLSALVADDLAQAIPLTYPLPVCQLVDRIPVTESEMESHLLLTTLHEKRIEVKYALITLVLTGGLYLLAANNVFDGLEYHVNTMMGDLAGYGAVGMFLIALPSNTTLVIQVPYNLPMFTLILYANTVWEVIRIGAATGLGAGIGEVVSYAVARAIIANIQDMEDSALFQWTKKQIGHRHGLIPYLVWFASAFPVPDLVMIVPVAMVNYPWRKIIVPMVAGKIFHNTVLALIFYCAADKASSLVSSNIHVDIAAIVVMLFVIIITYQIEKSRLVKREEAYLVG